MNGPAPWVWMITDRGGRVLAHGRQWTRLYAPAHAVAEERLAAWVWPIIRSGQTGGLDGVVCRVRRSGDHGRGVRVDASRWIRRAG